jgi:hypothetical protein
MATSVRLPGSAHWLRVAVVTLTVGVAVSAGGARIEASGNDQARATTIARMLRFVEWTPSAPGPTLTVAVVGNPSLATALRAASAGVQPGGRRLLVVDVASPRALSTLNVSVVVLGAEYANLAPRFAEQGVVTVGDDDCPDHGLVLSLLADGDRYRFRANPAAAARAGVSLSSRLLRLAQVVN